MMTWGNGLIRLVDFLNFSFRIHISRPSGSQCCVHFFVPHRYFSPCGLAMLRSLFRSASIFLALRARNAAFLQMKFFVPHPYFSPFGLAI